LGEEIYSFKLIKKIRGKNKERESRFLIFKHSNPYVYILITHEKYKFFYKDILSFTNKFYPKIARTYIDSKYMKIILQNLEKSIKGIRIRIKGLSAQRKITNKQAERLYETELKWTDISYEDMFRRVEENDQWIKSIYFTFIKNEDSINEKFKDYALIECQISRIGLFKCNRKYAFFYEKIIKYIIGKAIQDLKLFENRQRIKEERYKPKPITIQYNIDLFKDKNQNRRLIDVLENITYSSLSVFHSNPYLHCSFIDFKSGASYDIWGLSNNEITIVPQTRVTYASLERLCHYIFIGFREGIIKDYKK